MSVMLLKADARELPIADETIQCIVTSPPYWGLRDYGQDGQLGLERTPEEYIENMVQVFREVKRVLRKDGTVWLNCGDSYTSGGRSDYGPSKPDKNIVLHNAPRLPHPTNLKPKDLVGIPWRLALALQSDGWWLRSDIIWAKPNPMPESVTDRPTRSHEYVFLLTKSARYFYDADAVREENKTTPPTAKSWDERKELEPSRRGLNVESYPPMPTFARNPAGRNLRTVWTIPTQPFPEAHFATFPEKLVEPCIKAGTSHKACGICGAPWERVVEKESIGDNLGKRNDNPRAGIRGSGLARPPSDAGTGKRETLGFRPTCNHDDDSGKCIVLDPFGGSGTTARVAIKLGRQAISIDLGYHEMAKRRISGVQREMFV